MNPSSESTRLSVGEKVAYGLGDTASNFFFQAFNLFLVYYYTDVFGLSPAAVGTMMLFTRCLDAIMDPLMGALADRTQTKWGKYRPYLLWVAIPYGLIGYLMFSNPALSPAGKLVFAYITYSLMWVAYTAINIPYSALMGVMSSSSSDRTSLSTFRFAFAFTGAFLIGTLVLPLKNWLGGGSFFHAQSSTAIEVINQAAGFKYTMAIFAIVSVVLFFITFAKTKERVHPPAGQKNSIKADLKDLAANGPWLVLFFVAFLTLTNVGVRNAALIYFFKYNVGDEAKATFFMSSGSVAFIAGALATKLFLKFCDRRRLMIILTGLNAIAIAALYFIDPRQIVLLYVINFIGTFVAGPTPAIVWSLYADTADYGEWKFARRSTALVFSAAVFAQKVGLAVGSAFVGWALKFTGFVPNAIQAVEAKQGIRVMFTLVPGAFGLLSALAIIFYSLDDQRVRQIETDLKGRKSEFTAPAAA